MDKKGYFELFSISTSFYYFIIPFYYSNFLPRFSTSLLKIPVIFLLDHIEFLLPSSQHISIRRRVAAEGLVAYPVNFFNPTAEFNGFAIVTGEMP